MGRQNLKTWPFSVEKSPKSPKSQKFKKTKVVEVGNMFQRVTNLLIGIIKLIIHVLP